MRCIGRTANRFSRCKKNASFLFCREHRGQWWSIIAVLASIVTLYTFLEPYFKADQGILIEERKEIVKPSSSSEESVTQIISDLVQSPIAGRSKDETDYDSSQIIINEDSDSEKDSIINISEPQSKIGTELDKNGLERAISSYLKHIEDEGWKSELSNFYADSSCLSNYNVKYSDEDIIYTKKDSIRLNSASASIDNLDKSKFDTEFLFHECLVLYVSNNEEEIIIVDSIVLKWQFSLCDSIQILFSDPIQGEAPFRVGRYKFTATLTNQDGSRLLTDEPFKYYKGDVDQLLIEIPRPEYYGIYNFWVRLYYAKLGSSNPEIYDSKIYSIRDCYTRIEKVN
jgi:hypothetical protein